MIRINPCWKKVFAFSSGKSETYNFDIFNQKVLAKKKITFFEPKISSSSSSISPKLLLLPDFTLQHEYMI